jgi:hypothetical protein
MVIFDSNFLSMELLFLISLHLDINWCLGAHGI